ncbi:hypothetical protein ACYSNW_06895 [Enterococcus sp. LJL99]
MLDEDDSNTKHTVVPDNTDISFLTKKVLQNQECRNYFSSLLLNNERYDAYDVNKNLDYYCTKFLGTMFQEISIENFNMNLLLNSLHQILPTTYYEIFEKRWIANQKYYLHEYDESLELLTEAYTIANKSKDSISEWLIQDILIDLRNRENKILEIKNQHKENNFG